VKFKGRGYLRIILGREWWLAPALEWSQAVKIEHQVTLELFQVGKGGAPALEWSQVDDNCPKTGDPSG